MNSNLQQFKNYYLAKINDPEFMKIDSNNERLRQRFLAEYPISRIATLTLDEYALGKNDNNCFCHKMEFGDYGGMTCSISGYYAYMHGIWYKSEDNNYS